MSQSLRLRVAAIIVENERILLARHEKAGESYWLLPGGGVDFGERLDETLRRELLEEACVHIEPEALVLLNDSIAPDGERHVVNLCFTARIVEGQPRLGSDPRVAEIAFVPLEELIELRLYPSFGARLLEEIRNGFPNHAAYLGALWES